MISLLPPNDRKELNAARTNTLLLRYVFLVAAVIGFLLIELTVVYVFLKNEQARKESSIQENEQKSREYAPVKAKATEFNTNLKIASSIMQKQLPYAAILKEFSNTIPSGTAVDRIDIGPGTIGTPTQLNVQATSHTAVLAFKDAFNASKYFSDANILTISEKQDKAGGYPVLATVEVTFKKELLTLEDTQ